MMTAISNVGDLINQLNDIAKHIGDLSPLADTIKFIIWNANKDAVLGGVTPDGIPVAPLRPYTIRHRAGTGPPRAPRGIASRSISAYRVSVQVSFQSLTIEAGWPGFEYVIDTFDIGTAGIPARPISGFSQATIDEITEFMLEDYILAGTEWGGRKYIPKSWVGFVGPGGGVSAPKPEPYKPTVVHEYENTRGEWILHVDR